VNGKGRPPEGEPAPKSSSTTTTAILPRATVIYVVRGTRPTQYGPEAVTIIRRTRPAAQRAADRLDAKGRGPASIFYAPIRQWAPVPRDEPEEWS